MTISTETSKITAVGDGATTVFSGDPLKVFTLDDLRVIKIDAGGNESTLVRGTGVNDYKVTLTNPNVLPTAFSLTYPASGPTKLAVGEFLTIKLALPSTQLVDLENQGGYFPDTQEQMHDRAVILLNQRKEELDRAIKAAEGEQTLVNLTIPNTAQIPEGKLLGISDDKTSIEFRTAAGTLPDPVTVARGGTGATTAAVARTNLGATTKGDALFTAADAAAVRAELEAGTTGLALLLDETAGDARTTLGLGALAVLNSISASELDTDAVTTVKIQDDAVTLAKMAGLVRGRLIVGDASGNPATQSPGAAGTFLQSDGTDLQYARAFMEWAFKQSVATTSGTFKTLSGFDDDDIEILLVFNNTGTGATTTRLILQLGDSGGIEASGYTNWNVGTGITDGIFIHSTNGQTDGFLKIQRVGSGSFLWTGHLDDANGVINGRMGKKSLTGSLTQLRLNIIGGGSFNSGTVEIWRKRKQGA